MVWLQADCWQSVCSILAGLLVGAQACVAIVGNVADSIYDTASIQYDMPCLCGSSRQLSETLAGDFRPDQPHGGCDMMGSPL